MDSHNGQNPSPPKKNPYPPSRLKGLKPPFDGSFAGPGRPRLPEEIKKQRRDARQLLKDAAPWMAGRILELAESTDPDVAIKALKVGIDKVLPNLEEVENFEHRDLQGFDEHALETKLAEFNASTNGHTSHTGDQA